MRSLLAFFSVALIVLLGMLLLVSLFLAWSLGVGWLLQQVVPLTLFEASLLSSVASLAAGAVIARVLSGPLFSGIGEEDEIGFHDEPIPFTRFYPPGQMGLLKHWFNFRIANEIYIRLLQREDAEPDEDVLEEMAIDLAEIAIGVLKRKPPGTKRPLISLDAMQKEAGKSRDGGYKDEVLQLVVQVTNDLLADDRDLTRIVRRQLWDEPVTFIL